MTGEVERYARSSDKNSVESERDIQNVFQSVWPEIRALTNPSRRLLDKVLGGSLPEQKKI